MNRRSYPEKGDGQSLDWDLVGLGSEASEWERNTSGPSTFHFFPLSQPFFFLSFFSSFPVVDLFTCPHATHEKRKIGIINSNEGFVAIGITTI